MYVLPKSDARRGLLLFAEMIALMAVLVACGKALFKFLTAIVKLYQAMNEAKHSKKK